MQGHTGTAAPEAPTLTLDWTVPLPWPALMDQPMLGDALYPPLPERSSPVLRGPCRSLTNWRSCPARGLAHHPVAGLDLLAIPRRQVSCWRSRRMHSRPSSERHRRLWSNPHSSVASPVSVMSRVH